MAFLRIEWMQMYLNHWITCCRETSEPAGPYFSVFHFSLLSNTWLPWYGPQASWWNIHNWFWFDSLITNKWLCIGVCKFISRGQVLWSSSFSFTFTLICLCVSHTRKESEKWGRLDVLLSMRLSYFLSFALSHFLCYTSTHMHACTHAHLFFFVHVFFSASYTKQKQQDGLFCRWRQNGNDIKTARVTFTEAKYLHKIWRINFSQKWD